MAGYGFKIARMKTGDWGKCRAFFDLQSSDGFIMKSFKIVEGINGLFVSFPSIKNKDGGFDDQVFADKELRQKVNHLALDHYNSEKGKTKSESVGGSDNDPIPF